MFICQVLFEKAKKMTDEQKNLNQEKMFSNLLQTIEKLRDPEEGCPWDLEQDHFSLKPYLIEEAYETLEAIDQENSDHLCLELGDVLLQVLLHSQIAKEKKQFTIHDVIEGLNKKMKKRHPHVFGKDAQNKKKPSLDELKQNWEDLKKEENISKKEEKKDKELKYLLQKKYPSTLQAFEIGCFAKKNRFDWKEPKEVLAKFLSEVEELKDAWRDNPKTNLKDIQILVI